MADTTPLGPITPVRCTHARCPWAAHGIPDQYDDARAEAVAQHLAAEHAEPMPDTTPPKPTGEQLAASLPVDFVATREALGEMHTAVQGVIQLFIDRCPEGFRADDMAAAIVDACSDELTDLYAAQAELGRVRPEVDRLRGERDQARAGAFAEAIDRFRSLADLTPDSERAPGLNFAVGALMAMRDRGARTAAKARCTCGEGSATLHWSNCQLYTAQSPTAREES